MDVKMCVLIGIIVLIFLVSLLFMIRNIWPLCNSAKKKIKYKQDHSRNKIILKPLGTHLGDNLVCSTLPELYTKLGYDVYLPSDQVYNTDGIYNLVWKLNPYVKGTIDMPFNAGRENIMPCMYNQNCNVRKKDNKNVIKDIELLHDLTDGYRKYPVIYYKPKIIDELKNIILCDTYSFTTTFEDTDLNSYFKHIFKKHPGLKAKKITYVNINKLTNRKLNIDEIASNEYNINNIFDLCDAIFSCKVLAAGFTGSPVLGSAIKQDNIYPVIYSFIKDKSTTSTWPWHFENVNYIELKDCL